MLITTNSYLDKIISGNIPIPKKAGKPDLTQADQGELIKDLKTVCGGAQVTKESVQKATANYKDRRDLLVGALIRYLGKGNGDKGGKLERFIRGRLIPFMRDNINLIFT